MGIHGVWVLVFGMVLGAERLNAEQEPVRVIPRDAFFSHARANGPQRTPNAQELARAREHFRIAEQALTQSNTTADALTFIQLGRETLLRSGHSLSDVGLTEARLMELTQRGHEASARYWLQSARRNAEGDGLNARRWLELFQQDRERSEKPLSHFGVSERELRNIEKTANTAAARYWLAGARESIERNNGPSFAQNLAAFRQYQRESGEPLATFGIDEAGLLALERQGHIASARYWLDAAKRTTDNANLFTQAAVRAILASGAPLSTFNLSNAERERIRQVPQGASLLNRPIRLSANEIDPNFIIDLSCVQSTMRLQGIEISPKYLALQGFYAARSAAQRNRGGITARVIDAITNQGYCSADTYGGLPEADRAMLLQITAQPATASERHQAGFNRLFGVNPRVVTSLARVSPGALQASEALDRSNYVRGQPIAAFVQCREEMERTKNNAALRQALVRGCHLGIEDADAAPVPNPNDDPQSERPPVERAD